MTHVVIRGVIVSPEDRRRTVTIISAVAVHVDVQNTNDITNDNYVFFKYKFFFFFFIVCGRLFYQSSCSDFQMRHFFQNRSGSSWWIKNWSFDFRCSYLNIVGKHRQMNGNSIRFFFFLSAQQKCTRIRHKVRRTNDEKEKKRGRVNIGGMVRGIGTGFEEKDEVWDGSRK